MLPIGEQAYAAIDDVPPQVTTAPPPVRVEVAGDMTPVTLAPEPATANGSAARMARPTSGSHVDGGLNIIGTRLACVGGPYLGQSFPLSYHIALIGRSLDHAIALPADTSVSRIHAQIIYEGGRHVISDYGSSNGLLINDEPVTEPHTLRISDIIAVGSTLLRYE
jgi:hypothetical protein